MAVALKKRIGKDSVSTARDGGSSSCEIRGGAPSTRDQDSRSDETSIHPPGIQTPGSPGWNCVLEFDAGVAGDPGHRGDDQPHGKDEGSFHGMHWEGVSDVQRDYWDPAVGWVA